MLGNFEDSFVIQMLQFETLVLDFGCNHEIPDSNLMLKKSLNLQNLIYDLYL